VSDVVAVTPATAAATVGVAALVFVMTRRRWPLAVALLVGSYALSWTWVSWLRTPASACYWGSFLALMAWWLPTLRTRRAIPLLVGVSAAIAVLAASAAWSIDPHRTLSELARFAPVLLAATLVADRVARPADRAALVRALSLLAPAFVLASLAAAVALEDEIPRQLGGIGGVFDGPNLFGILVALTVPYTLAREWIARTVAARLCVVAGAGFLVALSAGRSGLVALVAALIAVGASSRRWLDLGVMLVCLCLAVGIAVTWSPAVPTFGQRTGLTADAPASGTSGEAASAGQLLGGDRPPGQSRLSALLGARDEAWREAWRLAGERPALGNGFGTGAVVFDHYGSRVRFRYFVGAFGGGQTPHNAYLQTVVELGVVGGLLLLLPLVLAGVSAAWLVARRRAGRDTAAFCGSLAAFLVAAVFEGLFAGAGAATLLGWLAAAAVLAVAAGAFEPVVRRRRAPSATVQPRPASTVSGSSSPAVDEPHSASDTLSA
jgi:O-antigen ligase